MITTKGIVIGERSIGEQDKYVDILTEDLGIVEVRAKSSKKLTAKSFASCNIYTYSFYTLREYKGKYYIDSTSPIVSFFDIATDIQKLALLNYFTDILKKTAADKDEGKRVLDILIRAMYHLMIKKIPMEQVKAVFELRIMCEIGYAPDLEECRGCGSESVRYFSVEDSCFYCEKCKPANALPTPVPVVIALRFIFVSDNDRAFMFKFKDESFLSVLGQVTEKYVFYHLDMPFKSIEYYNKVKSEGKK